MNRMKSISYTGFQEWFWWSWSPQSSVTWTIHGFLMVNRTLSHTTWPRTSWGNNCPTHWNWDESLIRFFFFVLQGSIVVKRIFASLRISALIFDVDFVSLPGVRVREWGPNAFKGGSFPLVWYYRESRRSCSYWLALSTESWIRFE